MTYSIIELGTKRIVMKGLSRDIARTVRKSLNEQAGMLAYIVGPAKVCSHGKAKHTYRKRKTPKHACPECGHTWRA